MGYSERLAADAQAFCLLVWFFYVLAPAVLNILLELIPYSTNRHTLTNAEKKTELPDYSRTYRATKYVYLPTSLIYHFSPS